MRLAVIVLVLGLAIQGLHSQQGSEHQWEERFRAVPDPQLMRNYMEFMSAHPHHVGSPYGTTVAEWILERFKEWGLDARIETFHVLFPTPTKRIVEMVEPRPFRAAMREPALEKDPTSRLQDEQLPTYNAYSIDGDVTAPLMYVNYGIPDDYEQLERMGLSVKGAIVIVRYGGSWRGIKPKLAAEKGAVGCIIYSDPQQDGYVQGDVYPEGPFRNKDGVQRGSVMDMPLYPGDPLTPGVPATMTAKRIPREKAETLTKIPVLPISYGDAQPLLEALAGPVAPPSWRGGLPITYHVGPGPARVHLAVSSSWDVKPIHNVIGMLKGEKYPSEWVLRGNHHDAWVFGAEDPISGMVSLLEEARALGQLARSGWKPKRTIVYCAWDGEEEGLLGSTEWVEAHADELRQKAVAYINTDGYGRGFVGMGGSHSLQRFMNDVAKDITDPETGLSVWKRRQLKGIADEHRTEERSTLRGKSTLPLGALGSGSDYTAFLDHAGIASLNLGYGGEDDGGIYHSIYDSFTWFTRFSDTSFVYGKTLAQTVGTAVLRLADAEILPYRFGDLASTAGTYGDELEELLHAMQVDARELDQAIAEGLYEAINDPRRPSVPPTPEEHPPHLNFAPLKNALDRLTASAAATDSLLGRIRSGGSPELDQQSTAMINHMLIESERKLTDPEGLSNRPWFRHLLYAPGFYTGYGVKTMPGIREAIEQKEWDLAEKEIVRLARALDNLASLLDNAMVALERVSQSH